jgi:hypothetical protein
MTQLSNRLPVLAAEIRKAHAEHCGRDGFG